MPSLNTIENAWTTLCPPAQIYPIVMSAIVLFNMYRGTYRNALSQFIVMIMGTIFLWVLCAANLDFAAYALLILPVLFFVFLLAIVFYDQSLLQISHTYKPSCNEEETCDSCPSC